MNNSFLQIVDSLQVYDNINLGRRIDPQWPNEAWRSHGGRNNWKNWIPLDDMEGIVSSYFISKCSLESDLHILFYERWSTNGVLATGSQ